MQQHILITSATGKTGFEAARQLLQDGYAVRILVRARNAKALELERLGAEVCIGELECEADLDRALHGIDRVYYCHPFMPNLLANTKLFIQRAKQNKVNAIVNMGQWLAEYDGQKSIHANDVKASYDEYAVSGLNVVQLIPGFFADNTFFVTEFAIQLGLMPLPFGAGKNAPISNADLGLVIAALLKNPEPYIGKRVRPTGAQSLSPKEMAQIFTNVVGRKVRYIPIPEWMFIKAGFFFAKKMNLDAFTISQVRHYMKEYQTNKFDGVTSVVKDLTGKEPDDFSTIVSSYVNKSPYRNRTFSNWCSAVRKFMALPLQAVPSVKELEKYNQ